MVGEEGACSIILNPPVTAERFAERRRGKGGITGIASEAEEEAEEEEENEEEEDEAEADGRLDESALVRFERVLSLLLTPFTAEEKEMEATKLERGGGGEADGGGKVFKELEEEKEREG